VPQAEGAFVSGSGFLISPDGYILTAYHVVRNAKRIFTRLASGDRQEAQIIGTHEETDSALLKIPGANYPTIPLGDPSKLRQGDEVLVFGYPGGRGLGVEDVTVTRGIISAFRLQGLLIQIDAAVNPGNSGGPVVTLDGLAVAIAFAKFPQFTGVNFAVSVEGAGVLLRKVPGLQVTSWQSGSPQSAGGLSTPYFPLDKDIRRQYMYEWVFLGKSLGPHRMECHFVDVTPSADAITVLEGCEYLDKTHAFDLTYRVTSRGIFEEHEASSFPIVTYMTPDLILPFPVNEGASWNIRTSTQTPTPSSKGGLFAIEDRTIQITSVGSPFSTVAGDFSDCVNIAGTGTTSGTGPNESPISYKTFYQEVFCKGVGLVLDRDGTDSGDSRTEQTLVSVSRR